MTNTRLEEKIVEFTETDWKLFPTFEHALQKWAEELLAEERKDLEKENAELKEHHKSVCESLTNTHRNIRGQLIKAKDLLKRWLKLYNTNTVKGIIADTEQFLTKGE